MRKIHLCCFLLGAMFVHWILVLGQWIHFHRKFTLFNFTISKNHISLPFYVTHESHIYDLVLLNVCHFHLHHHPQGKGFWKFIEILVHLSWILHPGIFDYWNHAEIDKLFSKNQDRLGKMSFMDFMFHANGDKWNHIHAGFTEILIMIHH